MRSSTTGRSSNSSRDRLQSFRRSTTTQGTVDASAFLESFHDEEVDNMSNPDDSYVEHDDSIEVDDKEFSSTKKDSAEGSSQELSGPLGNSDNLAVKRSKRLVYLVLTLVTGGFAVAVYFLISHEENKTFESKFRDFAKEILTSADSNAKDFLGKYQGISNTFTSYSIDKGAAWPNVTLPHFTIRTTESFEKVAGAELYIFSPMVTKANLQGYERYAWDHQGWIEQDLELRGLGKLDPGLIPARVYPHGGAAAGLEEHLSAQLHVPIWQVAPVPTDAKIVNLDLYSHPSFQRMIEECHQVRHTLLSEVVDRTFISESIQTLDSNALTDRDPRSYAVEPVYRDFAWDSEVVGFIFAVVPWFTYFLNILPPGTNNYIVEVQDSCGSSFYYKLDGPDATLVDDKDFSPNPDFAHLTQAAEFAEFARFDGESFAGNSILHCYYRLVVHPTDELKKEYESDDPVVYTLVVLAVFGLTVLTFVLYDYFVQRRQDKVMWAATRTAAIVSSLFPKNIQSKLMKEAMRDDSRSRRRSFSGKDMLKSFLGSESAADDDSVVFDTKPIADFFPETSILFGDIVGFTAWSSTREPSQVFKLLETIYHEFDRVANRRRIFKVETVGDCYVACTGLPDPRPDHAVAISRFAHECLSRLGSLLNQLETELGPDTGDLGMRVGIHSGPVTAGVLRGERARFQLFGDTMNTASRMESTGSRNMIQVSQETADLLFKGDMGHWVVPREDLVDVKGKGQMQTFWLQARSKDTASKASTSTNSDETSAGAMLESLLPSSMHASRCQQGHVDPKAKLNEKTLRLVDWNVDILIKMLQEIEARRLSTDVALDPCERLSQLEEQYLCKTDMVLNEVREIIVLPEYKTELTSHEPKMVRFSFGIVEQLRQYILIIASNYHKNAFHNFEHASHVTMSVVKLFSRIIAPDLDKVGENMDSLHDHTYGITSDSLTQFAVVLSALIHDVDHPGIPNSQMVREQMEVAKLYQGKSVAEQNSVDLAWGLLMKPEFHDLRRTIYKTEAEFYHFRELLVNSVLATDIMDADLKALRNRRWAKAFSDRKEESIRDQTNRKATIVIEHLMQASDVSHTMQHWHIYRKWNSRLFEELYIAYAEGRGEKNPVDCWYQGELGFFDFYIIPLAKKLKECGVFGVSSEEYLQYATNNRNEWERRGQEVVQELLRKLNDSGHLLPSDEPPPLKSMRNLLQGQGAQTRYMASIPPSKPPATHPSASTSAVKSKTQRENDGTKSFHEGNRELEEEGKESETCVSSCPSNDTLSSVGGNHTELKQKETSSFRNEVEC
ncbi:Receptor-type guanylate cyclase gcy [Seminavis robusta]|uniref:Receptor-type guanylate cyclase gcy n=1 Tax=Seminavis robusta TaxID=568900 RepID=A0A9N8EL60_9STRA|nr:Receptor-type guanylate cyclase gcy [Seminavis robusta]|eukprot:Sro1266_g257560.1 Receptor-type guanylate cyclase gcy (1294) ;mRNA; r:9763-15110